MSEYATLLESIAISQCISGQSANWKRQLTEHPKINKLSGDMATSRSVNFSYRFQLKILYL